tara:strand:+ start:796 stop:1254 length:459 start_codon:yes stop_codon:yes gene_type:complete
MYVINIDFEYHENYGAHGWNGKGECPQHWKPKGTVSRAITVTSMEEVENAMSTVITEEEKYNGDYSHTSYCGHSITEMEELKHEALVCIKETLEHWGDSHLLGTARFKFEAGEAAFDLAIDALEQDGAVVTEGPSLMLELLEVKSDVVTWKA